MYPASKPTKDEVRIWMKQRQVDHKPPPDSQTIRRELGWHLVSKPADCAR